MHQIVFYEDKNGKSEVLEFIEELRMKMPKSKDARIQYRQISLAIELLQNRGTNLPENYSKCLGDEIWEIRPGHNRIFYFAVDKDEIVLLHHFRKKSQKTPLRENRKAKAEKEDYLKRKRAENS